MIELMSHPDFWIATLQIIAIDILLGGDNAVVIALACRRLPDAQRNTAIVVGAMGAIVLRILLIAFALHLLDLPYLHLVGALLLLWIGVKLVLDEPDDSGEIKASGHVWGAIRTIIIADAVMSLDNVVAVAAAAKGELALVVIGIMISIPLIVWGAQVVLRLMERFPWVVWAGAALLGWIAGSMAVADEALPALPDLAHWITGATGAVLVLATGALINRHRASLAREAGR